MGKVGDPAAAEDPGFEAERRFLDRFRQAVAWAKEAGLTPTVSVIGGGPGETADDFRTTLAFVESLEVPVYAHNLLSVLPGTPLHRDRARHGLRVERDGGSGSWRTRHAYDVEAVRPLANSSLHLAAWDEANEVADAVCGRPRPARAGGDAAWAVVIHRDEPDREVAAWTREVLAVFGAVVVVTGAERAGRSLRRAWLETLDRAHVPWGAFTLLSRQDAGAGVLRAVGARRGHAFDVAPAWPAGSDGCAITVDEDGSCRVPLWLASEAARPPPARGARVSAPVPQIADGCRWWSGFRRCGDPRVLHAWPDSSVTACWHGPALGRVGERYAALVAGGLGLARSAEAAGAAGDRCPMAEEAETGARARSAAERWEVASQSVWRVRGAAAGR